MKTAFLFILLFLSFNLIIAQTPSSQKIYYKSDKGITVSQKQYDELKKEVISGFKKQGVDIEITDSFTTIEEKQDSIIKSYSFQITTLNPEEKRNNSPNIGKHLIGKKLPVEVLKSLDGSDFKLSDLTGKPTMINFWFTSCKPCIDEFPVLNNLKKKYINKVNFISITFENKEKVEKLIQRFPFEFQAIIGAKKYVEKLGIEAFPTSFFIDENGVIQKIEGGVPFVIENGRKKMSDGRGFELIIDSML